jgi:hypothetical protein
MWTVQEHEDVDALDAGFTHEFRVTDGKRSFVCTDGDDAFWLRDSLSRLQNRIVSDFRRQMGLGDGRHDKTATGAI